MRLFVFYKEKMIELDCLYICGYVYRICIFCVIYVYMDDLN